MTPDAVTISALRATEDDGPDKTPLTRSVSPLPVVMFPNCCSCDQVRTISVTVRVKDSPSSRCPV